MSIHLLLRKTWCRVFGHWWNEPRTLLYSNTSSFYHYFISCKICRERTFHMNYTCNHEEAEKLMMTIQGLTERVT